MQEVIDEMIKQFDKLNLRAQERAIEFLLTTENEQVFYFLEDKIINLMQNEHFVIPTNHLSVYPMLVKGILNRSLDRLTSATFKFPLYELIWAFNISGYEKGYKKDIILPILLEDYLAEKEVYIKLDADYTTKFVYSAWRDSYSITRNRMGLYIRLMDYYYSIEIENELKEASYFNDPILKTEAILVSIAKNLSYKQSQLIECAHHIESAEMTYWKLVDKNMAHLYPFTGAKQPHFAKTRLFFTVVNQSDSNRVFFPEDIQVVDKVDTENPYGHRLRYYLMSFKERDTVYAGWVGGFTFEDGEDTAHLTNDSYTRFIELDSMSTEEHKHAFLEKNRVEKIVFENNVLFESSPKINNFAWFLLFPLAANWLQLLSGNVTSLLFTIIFSIIIGSFFAYEIANKKRSKILIRDQQLVKQKGKIQHGIKMQDIKKIARNKKRIFIYDHNDELAFQFPLRWVRYELFYYHIKQHTIHLNKPPYIQS